MGPGSKFVRTQYLATLLNATAFKAVVFTLKSVGTVVVGSWFCPGCRWLPSLRNIKFITNTSYIWIINKRKWKTGGFWKKIGRFYVKNCNLLLFTLTSTLPGCCWAPAVGAKLCWSAEFIIENKKNHRPLTFHSKLSLSSHIIIEFCRNHVKIFTVIV